MNVIPLRPRPPVATTQEQPGGGSDLVIELQPAIDGLRSLRSDVESYYWGCPTDGSEDSERFEVSYWIRQLSDRSTALEGILLHKGSSRLRLRDVSTAEAATLEDAAVALKEWVHDDDPFDRVLRIVSAALAAADRTGLRAAGGTPEA